MVNIKNLQSKFPTLPELIGSFAPIYYEPIALSGERYTVCVAGVMNDGTYRVFETIDRDRLICMFGSEAVNVSYFISQLSDTLSAWLDTTGSFESFQPHISNMHIGEVATMNAHSISDLIKIGIRSTSALANLSAVDASVDLIESEPTALGSLTTRWIKSIKTKVVEMNPNARANFDKTIGKVHKYHFVGNHYVANFATMNPARSSGSMNEAKKLLWDLSVVKDYSFDLENVELLMYLPKFDEIQYSPSQFKRAEGLLKYLEDESDKKNIRLIITDKHEVAVKRLIDAA